jgi:hypothetical protein
MILALVVVYGVVFLALGFGVMIAMQAQREHESTEPELGTIPEHAEIKRHRATGWKYW